MQSYKHPIGPAWQDSRGYWRISVRDKRGRRKTRYLHRLIYAQTHGRIRKGYVIHHIDGNKGNCSLDNLRLMSTGTHSKHHNLGHRPSHVVRPDGTVVKKCLADGEYWPLKEMVCSRTRAGSQTYRPYCHSCYYWTYGWGKSLLEAQT